MRLYLSSYRIPTFETLKTLLPKKTVTENSLLIITNSKDYREPINAKQRIEDLKDYLTDLGFQPGLLDLRDFQHDPNKLKNLLEDVDILYAIGGSQYGLMLALENSEIRTIICNFIQANRLYIGESAGAMIIGEDLDLDDDPEEKDQVPRVITKGLGIVAKSFLPHADSEYKEYGNRAQKVYRDYANKEKLVLLDDNQVFVVDGDKSWVDTGEYQEMR